MPLDLLLLPANPHLVPVFKPTLAGVDFLNLRQVNLDLMGECIPGTNNATKRIRAYSLITWVYWKYYQILEHEERAEADSEELIHFREKVESLFVWSHQLAGEAGMPGITAKPPKPKDGKVDLRFKAWKRSRANTSLEAAVQYGPSITDLGGLGFLRKVAPGVFACNPAGQALASAFDEQMKRSPAYDFLADIKQLAGTEADARDLLPYWHFDNTSVAEAEAFKETLWDPGHVGENTARGRRASMIELILKNIHAAGYPLTLREIRKQIALPHTWHPEPLPDGLLRQSRSWLVLQLRQLQRFALESLMSWLEMQLLETGHQFPNSLVDQAMAAIQSELGFIASDTTQSVLLDVCEPISSLEEFSQKGGIDPDWFCPWTLCDELADAVKSGDDRSLTSAIYALLLLNQCRPFLESDGLLSRHLDQGGSARQSLAQWFRIVDRLDGQPFRSLVDWVVKNLVISQHLAVGTQRFDGEKIRLRMILEEDGLESLLSYGNHWQPGLTPDRLSALLSLLECCFVIEYDEGYEISSSGNYASNH